MEGSQLQRDEKVGGEEGARMGGRETKGGGGKRTRKGRQLDCTHGQRRGQRPA